MQRETIINIFDHFDIDYWTEGKNVAGDAVNIKCPFCNDHSNHCGIFPESGLYHCWRCDAKGTFVWLITTVAGISEKQAKEIIGEGVISFKEDTEKTIRGILDGPKRITKAEKDEVTIPSLARKITEDIWSPRLRMYLKKREICIETCIKFNCYICDVGIYTSRMIIPIYYKKKLVSFQGADMTGRSDIPYKSAPGDINDYLYGYDDITDIMILTEGMLDRWRMKWDTVATFGKNLSDKQKNLIIKKNPNLLVFAWDSDAYWQAKEHAGFFSPFISNIKIIEFPKGEDPDSFGYLPTWQLIEETTCVQ